MATGRGTSCTSSETAELQRSLHLEADLASAGSPLERDKLVLRVFIQVAPEAGATV